MHITLFKRFFLFFIIFFILPAMAVDINTSYADANNSAYEHLLNKLSVQEGTKENTLELSLQEALLKRLLNFSKEDQAVDKKLDHILSSTPTDIKSFKTFFKTTLNASKRRDDLKNRLHATLKHMQSLKDQLQRKKREDNTTLTLQLQYAFYKKSTNLYNTKINHLNTLLEKVPEHIIPAIGKLSIDSNLTVTEIKKIENQISHLDKNYEELRVERERLNIIGGRNSELSRIDTALKSIERARQDLKERKLVNMFILFVNALQKKDQSAFAIANRMKKMMEDMNFPHDTRRELASLFNTLEKKRFGAAATIHGAAKEQLKLTADLILEKLNAPIFNIGKTQVSAFKLMGTLLVFAFGLMIAFIYKKSIRKLEEHGHHLSASSLTLLSNLGYYLIVTLAFFISLKILGIDLSSIALVAGALSVGIGFGLQNIVSNFVSGIILMFERSIKIGDYIELTENLKGHVTDIRMRSITVNTNANIDVIVPNQELVQNRVINWTMNDEIRRYEIPFSVAYGTDADKVIKVVLSAVEKSGFEDIYTSRRRKTRVVMTEMGDSGVNFMLFVWVRGREVLYPKITNSRFLILIYKALNEAGIEIPFPQRDIHIRSVDGNIPLDITGASLKDSSDITPQPSKTETEK